MKGLGKLGLTILILAVFVVSCNQQTKNSEISSNTKPQEQIQEQVKESPILKTATKEPSEFILNLSDLTEGYMIKERTPRLKSDVSKEALDLGWKEGYYVRYGRRGEDIFDTTSIDLFISIYPIETIQKVIELPKESIENATVEELPNPNIGDKRRAFRITSKDESFNEERVYAIEFIKMDVYVNLVMYGTSTDYEFLKTLAKRIEAKIK